MSPPKVLSLPTQRPQPIECCGIFGSGEKTITKSDPEDPVAENLFEKDRGEVSCKWFVFCSRDAKRLHGKYPTADVVGFSSRIAHEQDPVQYLQQAGSFELRNTLDTVCVGLRKQGIGSEVTVV